jgi:1-acyl-sn-glycerol-3-phosphate acyltransferase
MRRGISLLVYPEGTSSDGKNGLLPFKSTPFAAAIESGAEIVPTLIFYRERPENSPPAAWFGDISFGAHVWRSLGIKRIDADLYILKKESISPGEDRKTAASRIHDAMEKEYWKIEN